MKKILAIAAGLLACIAVPALAHSGVDIQAALSLIPQHGDLAGSLALAGIGMTTLAKDAPRDFFQGDFHDFPVIATDIIYGGAAVGDNGSGYARPLVAGDPFRGFADYKADNSTGAAGDIYVRCRTKGRIRLPISALAITDVGKDVYASDDDTFTLTQGTNTRIGFVAAWIETGYGVIEFQATHGVLTELTDNTGGTANTTLTALGGITTLTDSTGLSGTHDDTLAATTVPADITDNGGGAAADGTIGAITLTEPANLAAQAVINNQLADAVKELSTKLNAALAVVRIMAQNDSDIAQKVIELVADMDDAKNNFADLTASVNSIIRSLGN